MACSRGRANPDGTVKVRLFASSAGYCQNPECLEPLFHDIGSRAIHFAEIAHIFAAQDDGPRPNPAMTAADRGRFENLILLCANCHTKIDKAPEAYPDTMIRDWKQAHEARIAEVFGIRRFPDRPAARQSVSALLDENKGIFDALNPDLDYRFDPEAEQAAEWSQAMLARIIPNNRKLLLIADANRELLTAEEREAVEQFRRHVDGLVNRHLAVGRRFAGARFPPAFANVFA